MVVLAESEEASVFNIKVSPASNVSRNTFFHVIGIY